MFFVRDDFTKGLFGFAIQEYGLLFTDEIEIITNRLARSNQKLEVIPYFPSATLLALMYNRNLLDNKLVTIEYMYKKALNLFITETTKVVLDYNKKNNTDYRHTVGFLEIDCGKEKFGLRILTF